MELAHSSVMGGHIGIKQTTDRIRGSFFWPGMEGDVKCFCRSCDICQKTVSQGRTPEVPLGEVPLIDTPFKSVTVDLVGSYSPSFRE